MATLLQSVLTPRETLSNLLARQRAAFLRHGPPSLAERRTNLKKLRAALLARRADFEAALDVDFGHRSRHETAIMEMLVVTWGLDYLHKHLRRFMRRERRHVALKMRLARAYVEYQPLGVVGIVAPWNYPFSLALMPLARSCTTRRTIFHSAASERAALARITASRASAHSVTRRRSLR